MKPFLRVLGIDDGYFKPRTKTKTLLVGIVYRLGHRVEGILSSKISVDGFDSTKQIIKMAKKTKFSGQVAFIILSGINFAGFNVADIKKIHSSTKLPVIVVFRKKPRMEKIKAAIKKTTFPKKRFSLIEQGGQINPFKSFFFQVYGCTKQEAKTILRKTLLHSNMPEPVRLAHLIASGITIGESTRP